MGLDLIPRVDGEVVDADSTSVVELYKVVSYILFIHNDYACYILGVLIELDYSTFN